MDLSLSGPSRSCCDLGRTVDTDVPQSSHQRQPNASPGHDRTTAPTPSEAGYPTPPPPIPSAAPPDHLTFESRHGHDSLTLIVRGEIDLASALALERELHHAESSLPRRIVLDLAALDFIDAAGLRALTRAQQRADINGHKLVLTHLPANTRRLFSIVGINTKFTIE